MTLISTISARSDLAFFAMGARVSPIHCFQSRVGARPSRAEMTMLLMMPTMMEPPSVKVDDPVF